MAGREHDPDAPPRVITRLTHTRYWSCAGSRSNLSAHSGLTLVVAAAKVDLPPLCRRTSVIRCAWRRI